MITIPLCNLKDHPERGDMIIHSGSIFIFLGFREDGIYIDYIALCVAGNATSRFNGLWNIRAIHHFELFRLRDIIG